MKAPKQPPEPRPGIVECFADVPDPRVNRTLEHKVVDILVIGLCATLTVGENFTDMEAFGKAKESWLKTFLELPGGIPSHDTFNRVFSAIDPDAFLACFVRWTRSVCTALKDEVVAIDGKSLRRAFNEGERLPHVVSAWAAENGLTLGQVKVDDKSNEITAIPELLRVLELKGCIVTIDAMGTQKDIAGEIVAAGADYTLALKGNHETARDEFQAYFDDAVPEGADANTPRPKGMDFHQSTDKGHGRVEVRRYWHTDDIHWFEDKANWAGLASVGMVESTRIQNGQKSTERRMFLCSYDTDAKKLAHTTRGHWGVENPLHWTLDVTFGEDQNRARTRNAAQNLAALRRLALNIAKNEKTKIPIRQKRIRAALDEKFLQKLLGI